MNKFKIHPFTYIFIFIIIINGEFNKFASIMNIILFHELGHILSGLFFKWKIDKIIILPFVLFSSRYLKNKSKSELYCLIT